MEYFYINSFVSSSKIQWHILWNVQSRDKQDYNWCAIRYRFFFCENINHEAPLTERINVYYFIMNDSNATRPSARAPSDAIADLSPDRYLVRS